MNKAIERMKGGFPMVEDAGRWSDYTRETLAMMREASREIYGDHWRDDWQEVEEEFHDGDESEGEGEADSLTLDGGDMIAEARGWRSRALTCELVDQLED